MKNQPSSSLQTYLLGLGGVTLLAATSNASIIQLNIGAISGVNAGLVDGANMYLSLSTLDSGLDGWIYFYTSSASAGLSSKSTHIAASGVASPTRFTLNSTIDSSASWKADRYSSFFLHSSSVAPAWGPGSYMGFKSQNGHYGWLEVTWNPTTNQFQIFSGAYESVAGTAILAGAIPEPSSLALLVAGAGAVAVLHRRRKAA